MRLRMPQFFVCDYYLLKSKKPATAGFLLLKNGIVY